MELNSTIKKLIVLNAIFGGKASKLTGVRDSLNKVSDLAQFDSVNNSITFANTIPSFLVKDQFFRITEGGSTDHGHLFKVKNVLGKTLVLDSTFSTLITDFFGNITADARIFVQINDPKIALEASDGSTQFNANATSLANNSEIGPSVASNHIEHYHDDLDNSDSEYRIELFKEDDPSLNTEIDSNNLVLSTGLGYIEVPNIKKMPIVEVWKYDEEKSPFLLGKFRLNTRLMTQNSGKNKSYVIVPQSISWEDEVLRIDFVSPLDGHVVLKGIK